MLAVEIGLLVSFAVFAAIVLWVVLARPGPFRRAARIPLDEGTVVTPRPRKDNP